MAKKETSQTLSTGIRAIIRPVPAMLVDKMVNAVKDPEIPLQYIEEKDREERNSLDPTYLREMDDAQTKRGEATMMAMIMFGIELVDGIPDPDLWLPRLEWMSKHTSLDLGDWDLDDPLDLEYMYKALVATSGTDLMLVTIKSGMTSEEVDLSMRGFRSDEEPDPDPTSESEVST